LKKRHLLIPAGLLAIGLVASQNCEDGEETIVPKSPEPAEPITTRTNGGDLDIDTGEEEQDEYPCFQVRKTNEEVWAQVRAGELEVDSEEVDDAHWALIACQSTLSEEEWALMDEVVIETGNLTRYKNRCGSTPEDCEEEEDILANELMDLFEICGLDHQLDYTHNHTWVYHPEYGTIENHAAYPGWQFFIPAEGERLEYLEAAGDSLGGSYVSYMVSVDEDDNFSYSMVSTYTFPDDYSEEGFHTSVGTSYKNHAADVLQETALYFVPAMAEGDRDPDCTELLGSYAE